MKEKWEFENLSEIVKTSKTQKEVLIKIGIRSAGGNYKTLRKYIDKYDIDTTHFVNSYDRMVFLSKDNKVPLKEILAENSSFSRTHLKERLYREGIFDKICCLCGQDENWNGFEISLILDHINGVYNDNRLKNLRIVCPNCNAGLDTHCGKNLKKNRYNCLCGEEIIKNSKLCNKCAGLKRRKVKRPNKEKLLKEVKEFGYSATGRKYGVSDNSIRKWIK